MAYYQAQRRQLANPNQANSATFALPFLQQHEVIGAHQVVQLEC